MVVTFFKVLKAREVANSALQHGLSAIGHLNKEVEVVGTFQYSDEKYAAIESVELLDPSTINKVEKRLTKFGDAGWVEATEDRYLALELSKKKVDNSRYRLWFDRATYC